MTEYVKVNVEITQAAETFIRRMMRFVKGPDAVFRMLVKPGGCLGYAVTFDLLEAPGEEDYVWEQSGLRISSDYATSQLLKGATVDFIDSLSHTGFVVTIAGGSSNACSPSSQLVPASLLVAR